MPRSAIRLLPFLCALLPIAACTKRVADQERVSSARADTTPSPSSSGSVLKGMLIAAHQEKCDRLVADETHVFWTTRSDEVEFAPESTAHTGHVMSCAVTGCGAGPTLVASAQSHVDAIAIDGADVYWTRRGFHGVQSAIHKCSRTNCVAPATVYSYASGGGPTALAVDPSGVYWTDSDDRSVKTCPREGCSGAPNVLAKGTARPQDVTAADGSVYWSNDDGTVVRCAARGCDGKPSIIGAAHGEPDFVPGHLRVDEGNVYWVNHRGGDDGGANGHATEVLTCPISGCAGPPRVVLTVDGSIAALVARGGSIYWAQRGGQTGDAAILSCEAVHCDAKAVVVAADVRSLALSSAGLFFTDERTHEIRMLRLP